MHKKFFINSLKTRDKSIGLLKVNGKKCSVGLLKVTGKPMQLAVKVSRESHS